jgi:hypothetical protein
VLAVLVVIASVLRLDWSLLVFSVLGASLADTLAEMVLIGEGEGNAAAGSFEKAAAAEVSPSSGERLWFVREAFFEPSFTNLACILLKCCGGGGFWFIDDGDDSDGGSADDSFGDRLSDSLYLSRWIKM